MLSRRRDLCCSWYCGSFFETRPPTIRGGHSTIRFMTNRSIEMHDSKLQSIAVSTGYVVLEFSPAYIHQSAGRPGIDAGTGWTQRAVVRVRGDVVSGSLTELPCRLSSGWITLNEHHYENEIPIPLSFDGDVK